MQVIILLLYNDISEEFHFQVKSVKSKLVCAQDVLPNIVNFVLTCPSLVVLAKRKRGVLKEFVITSFLPHKQPQRHLQISPKFQMVNYRHIRGLKGAPLVLYCFLRYCNTGMPTCSNLNPTDSSITCHRTEEIIQVCVQIHTIANIMENTGVGTKYPCLLWTV